MEPTVTMSLKDYELLKSEIKSLAADKRRLENIVNLPEVKKVLHLEDKP